VRAFSSVEVAIQNVSKQQSYQEKHMTGMEFSKIGMKLGDEYHQVNKEYFDMLDNTQARQDFFKNLAKPNSSDHSEVAKVKEKINSLIKEELALAGFKDQVTAEELQNLEQQTFAEVATKKNFYFSLDEEKVKKNLRVYNLNAPGNHYRHPNVILPHEHVHIQHYVDVNGLDKDKLFEIYGYYSLLIDMHIAQIRPGIVEEKSYVPAHMN